MPYYLSNETYAKLERFLASREGGFSGGVSGGGVRQICYVEITSDGPDADGYYDDDSYGYYDNGPYDNSDAANAFN